MCLELQEWLVTKDSVALEVLLSIPSLSLCEQLSPVDARSHTVLSHVHWYSRGGCSEVLKCTSLCPTQCLHLFVMWEILHFG